MCSCLGALFCREQKHSYYKRAYAPCRRPLGYEAWGLGAGGQLLFNEDTCLEAGTGSLELSDGSRTRTPTTSTTTQPKKVPFATAKHHASAVPIHSPIAGHQCLTSLSDGSRTRTTSTTQPTKASFATAKHHASAVPIHSPIAKKTFIIPLYIPCQKKLPSPHRGSKLLPGRPCPCRTLLSDGTRT